MKGGSIDDKKAEEAKVEEGNTMPRAPKDVVAFLLEQLRNGFSERELSRALLYASYLNSLEKIQNKITEILDKAIELSECFEKATRKNKGGKHEK